VKTCSACRDKKTFDDFYRATGYKDGFGSRCKECTKKFASKSHRDNPERTRGNSERWRKKMKDQLPDYRRRRKFGLELGEFERRSKAQGGLCAICKEARDLVVDHCHTSGDIRGLLCKKCNSGIGFLGDNPDLLRSALAYLTKVSLVGQP
jgi:hypothetical protein